MRRLGILTFCTQVCVFLASLMGPRVDAAPGCPAGWFGADCRLRCNCEQSQDCGVGGLCPNNGECKSPYFGRGCQYVDVLQTHASANTPIFVRDRNHSTCNPDPTDRSLQVSLVDPQPSLWFTVYASNTVTLFHRNFTVKVDHDPETQVKMFKIQYSNALEVRIYNHSTTMTKLTIEGPVVPYICTINVSKGRNIALHQNVTQSSHFPGAGLYCVRAENAVDGNTDSDFDMSSCAHTAFESTKSHWEITFDRPYRIHLVHIFNRNEHMDWLSGFSLSLYNETGRLQYLHVDSLTAPVPVYTISPSQGYTTKALRIEANSPNCFLVLCEVEVYGESTCPRNMYGLDCEHQCECDNSVQSSDSAGSCPHVPDYYCPPGTYGELCELSCSQHCKYSLCDAHSGACSQCIPGYLGDFCDKDCNKGRFGENCTKTCPRNCQTCGRVTGACLSCLDHWTGPTCQECQSGWFGENCSRPCPRLCNSNLCHRLTGLCLSCAGRRTGPKCEECTKGWFGVGCNAVCPGRCLGRLCNKMTGNCVSCIGHFAGPKCQECQKGRFGVNCSRTCPRICPPDQCDKITGRCMQCLGRRIGPTCQDCPTHYYGALCDIPCTVYCKNRSCNKMDGSCYMCYEGFRGEYCNIEAQEYPPSVYLLPLIIPYLLLVLCCGLMGGGSTESEEE